MPKHPVLRWTVRIGATVVALVLVAASGLYGFSARRMSAHFEVPEHAPAVPTDSATIAHGERLATVRGCIDCHGETFGGKVLVEDPALGRLAGPNLTRGRSGPALTDADWERAVRHGVRRDGSSLVFMPSAEFAGMTDEDLTAIVAYARSLPADTSRPPTTVAGPVMRALYLAGQVDLMSAEKVPHARPHVASMHAEPTARYGEYLAAGCTGCHGAGFSGGKIPGTPPDWKPAANITPSGIGHYSDEQFARVMRTGRRPDGTQVDSLMPTRLFARMTDVEIAALRAYLRTVPPKAYGQR